MKANKKEIKKINRISSFFLLFFLQKSFLEGFYTNFYKKIGKNFEKIQSIHSKLEGFRFINKFIQYYNLSEKEKEIIKKNQKKNLFLKPSEKQGFFSFFDFYKNKPLLERKKSKKVLQRNKKKQGIQTSRFFQENFFFAAVRPKLQSQSFGEVQPTTDALLRYGFSYKIESEKDLSSFLGMNIRFHWIRGNYIGGASQYVLDLILFFLKKRIPYRRLCSILFREIREQDYIQGIRITYAGRLGGKTNKAVRSKKETKKIGKPSLHIFSAKIDFAQGEVQTKFGMVGIKIWIRYK